MSTWGVTPAIVLEATKATVSTADIAMAGEIIDLYSNRTEAASAAMRSRDRTWLTKAVLWQAVKCAQEPDLASKMAPGKIIQDGVEIDVSSESAWTLAPMAARALRNLSWKGTRTRRARSAVDPLSTARLPLDFLNEASDDLTDWQEL